MNLFPVGVLAVRKPHGDQDTKCLAPELVRAWKSSEKQPNAAECSRELPRRSSSWPRARMAC